MQKIFSLLLLSLVLAACTSEKVPTLPKDAVVVILGDSLSYGTGAAEGEDYPTLLAENTGWTIINAGVPGDTTADGLIRLPALLEEYRPQLLMIALGGNDFLRRTPNAQTITNLKAIIQQAKSKDTQVLLIAIPEFSPVKAAFGGLPDHPLYEKIAEETQVLLIEDTFTDVLSKNSLKADQIHPNAEGYREVEAQLRESLSELGLFVD